MPVTSVIRKNSIINNIKNILLKNSKLNHNIVNEDIRESKRSEGRLLHYYIFLIV